MKNIKIGWKRLVAILKNVTKVTEIRYIFQTLTPPKLLNHFQPNHTQMFYRVLGQTKKYVRFLLHARKK